MPLLIHAVRRADLPENGVLAFAVAGSHYVVADIDGEVCAFAVDGPAGRDLGRAVIAEGRLRCPMHGWPIDPQSGQCGAGQHCRYEPLAVEADETEIRVALPGP